MFEELRFFARGRTFRAFGTPWGRAGLLICRDFLHLNAHYLLFADGAEISITISAAPGRGVAGENGFATSRMWEVMGETAARLTTSVVVYCNRVGIRGRGGFRRRVVYLRTRSGNLVAQAALRRAGFPPGRDQSRRYPQGPPAATFKRDDRPEVTLANLERIVHRDED